MAAILLTVALMSVSKTLCDKTCMICKIWKSLYNYDVQLRRKSVKKIHKHYCPVNFFLNGLGYDES